SAACQFVGSGTGSNPPHLVWKYSKRNPDVQDVDTHTGGNTFNIPNNKRGADAQNPGGGFPLRR
ncbi:6363_t:CDS:1, partial [Acaulospora morrowiae]